MSRQIRLAIDFDNTIVDSDYPTIFGCKLNAKKVIRRLKKDGYFIIINTCRAQEFEVEAKEFLVNNFIPFDLMNCNKPEDIAYFGMDCRKISADLYIDDKQLLGIPDDWEDIYGLIIEKFREWK